MKTVVVIGATGRIGTPAVQELVARGARVNALTRSGDKADKFPAGATGIVGDLEKPDTLKPLFKDADALLLITANGETETARGMTAVAAAKAAGVGRIVLISVIHAPDLKIPHFVSKLPIEAALQRSGIPNDILRPNFFFQNDLLTKAALVKFGIYPHPIGQKGQNRIDCGDIGAAAANLLLRDGTDSSDHVLQGPDTLTGDQVAAIYSKYMGREIRYGGDDLAAWENAAKAFMPPWLLHSIKVGYADMQTRGAIAKPGEIADTRALVGRELSHFEPWAKAVCVGWAAQG